MRCDFSHQSFQLATSYHDRPGREGRHDADGLGCIRAGSIGQYESRLTAVFPKTDRAHCSPGQRLCPAGAAVKKPRGKAVSAYEGADAAKARWEFLRNTNPCRPEDKVTIFGSHYGRRMMRWIFCVSLWLSSVLAIWLVRGWIGLFFSGQVLSAGVYLWKGLARRTQRAYSPNGESLRTTR